jgi:hypothetical protein
MQKFYTTPFLNELNKKSEEVDRNHSSDFENSYLGYGSPWPV